MRIYKRAELEAMTDDQLIEVYKNIDRYKKIKLGPLPPPPDDMPLTRNVAIEAIVGITLTQNNILSKIILIIKSI